MSENPEATDDTEPAAETVSVPERERVPAGVE
jgi:hypothetical protein